MDTAIFETMEKLQHEELLFCQNEEFGLKAIIGIHSTVLGPALGGLRLYPYASESDAITDVLRLSRGMTYKAAISNLDLGGGKAVIIGNPSVKSEGLFRAFGRHVESLGGRYITAEDMNTCEQDMGYISKETQWVTGLSKSDGGNGDPSPVTAWGVYHGLRACLNKHFGTPDPRGRKVAIQGVGSVGYYLSKYLSEAGAELFYSDINQSNLQIVMSDFGGKVVDNSDFYATECDVLAPCAIGATINERSIPIIKAPIIAGGANNQLEKEVEDGERVKERGLIYAPDYVINAGGLMSVYNELISHSKDLAMDRASGIYDTIGHILQRAEEQGITSIMASNAIAEERIKMGSRLREHLLPRG